MAKYFQNGVEVASIANPPLPDKATPAERRQFEKREQAVQAVWAAIAEVDERIKGIRREHLAVMNKALAPDHSRKSELERELQAARVERNRVARAVTHRLQNDEECPECP